MSSTRSSRLALFSSALLVALILAACGGQATPAPAAPAAQPAAPTTAAAPKAAAGQPVELVWSFWGNEQEVALNNKVIEAFQAKNPNIKIKTQFEPFESYFDKLRAQWAGGTSPDVMFLNSIPVYAALNQLQPLDDLIARDKFDLADYYPGLLEIFKYGGKVYGLPRDNDTQVIFYNKKAFDEAGVPYPKKDWTFQEMRDTAAKLVKKDGDRITRYGFAPAMQNNWRIYVWANGGQLYDDSFKPTKSAINTPQAVAAIDFLGSLYRDKIVPPDDQINTGGKRTQLFLNGQVAMVQGNHASLPAYLAANPNFQFDIVPMPRGQKGPANNGGGAGYVISNKTKNLDAAWEFFKFLNGPEGQTFYTENGLITPARRSIGKSDVFLKQKPDFLTHQVFLDATEAAVPVPQFPKAAEALSTYNTTFEQVWAGTKSAADAVAEAEKKVNDILARP